MEVLASYKGAQIVRNFCLKYVFK